jgi:hypothetical protein
VYEARPFRVYVIDPTDAVVLYRCGLAPFNMRAKLAELEAFLRT